MPLTGPYRRVGTVVLFVQRNLADLIKAEERLKIRKGELRNDVALDRPLYDSSVPKAHSENITVKAYKLLINAKCFNDRQKRRWLPVVKGQIIYGTNSVREALNADRRQVYKLYFKRNFLLGRREDVRKKLLEEILSVAESKDIRIKELSTDQLDALCGYQLHNGICIDATPLQFEKLDQRDLVSSKSLLFLDNVLDTSNIAAIARTCVFFNLDGIVMSENAGPKTITPAMSRSSSGAIECFPLYKVSDATTLLENAKNLGFVIIGASDEASAAERNVKCAKSLENLDTLDQNQKFILVLGNEHTGISEEVLKFCNYIVFIPKLGSNYSQTLNSLNVSAASAILLYQMRVGLRRRKS
ncbi:unnamed protein product [Enterobius vermicularis]|uniref:rRNA methyltransferase 1, mitochondrial n=1 Tax=Enterobius vermicularis TaxID=51028 RepID=A0A0N4V9Q5_ENTVE|nr:unnamed protein product [Enterobius vermicularis]